MTGEGTYDSGFPDGQAYQDWLFRIDNLAEDHRRLTSGEHVSGPAADAYRPQHADVRRRAHELREHADDRLAPSMRHHRERAELDRLQAIIRRHDYGK